MSHELCWGSVAHVWVPDELRRGEGLICDTCGMTEAEQQGDIDGDE